MVDHGYARQRRACRRHARVLVWQLLPEVHGRRSRARKRVAWKSPLGQGNAEWEGTDVTFDLSTDDKQTFVQFKHSRWRESTNFQGHCSMRWAVFLLSLKDLLEREKGRPVPYDLEVHHR